jgi:hypothetical protein
MRLLLGFSALTLIAIFWMLTVVVREPGRPLEAWLPPALVSGFVVATAIDPRAQVLGHLLLLCLIWMVPVSKSLRVHPAWLLPLLALWSNLHSSAILGLLWVVIAWLECEGKAVLSRRKAISAIPERRLLRRAALYATAGSLATPWGFRLWYYPLMTSNHPFTQQVVEWEPLSKTQFSFQIPIYLLFIGLVGLPLLAPKLYNPGLWLLTMGFGVGAFASVIYAPFFALLAAPHIALYLHQWSQLRGRDPLPTPANQRRASGMSWEGSLNTVLLLALAPALANHLPRLWPNSNPMDDQRYPVLVAKWMSDHSLKGRIFNHFDWGGYLIYSQWPRMKVFVDGRNETVYPLPVLMDCLKAQQGDRTFVRDMARRAEWALWPVDHPTAQILKDSDDWEVAIADDQAVLFRSRLLNPHREKTEHPHHLLEPSPKEETALPKSRER